MRWIVPRASTSMNRILFQIAREVVLNDNVQIWNIDPPCVSPGRVATSRSTECLPLCSTAAPLSDDANRCKMTLTLSHRMLSMKWKTSNFFILQKLEGVLELFNLGKDHNAPTDDWYLRFCFPSDASILSLIPCRLWTQAYCEAFLCAPRIIRGRLFVSNAAECNCEHRLRHMIRVCSVQGSHNTFAHHLQFCGIAFCQS